MPPPRFLHRVILPWWLTVVVGVAAVVAVATGVIVHSLIVEQALNQSRSVADMAEHIGTWASRYGGLYVGQPAGGQPAHIGTFLERHVYRSESAAGHAPAGPPLASSAALGAYDPKEFDAYYSKNPALIQREVGDISAQSPTGNRFRLTARSVFNPANAADAFERRALDALQGAGSNEYFEVFGGQMRYARSIVPDRSCLTCHGAKADAPSFMRDNRMFTDGGFGYVEGRPDAIISVNVHMVPIGKAVTSSLSMSGWVALLALLAALLGLVALAARRIVAGRMRAQQRAMRAVEHLRVRQAERESIAADLHDTLLQGLYGLLLRMQALSEHLPDSQTRAMLESAIVRTERLATEGRDRVSGLLRSPLGVGDLGEQLAEVAADVERAHGVQVHVQVSGATRALAPEVQEQLHLIGREALSNAASHAAATRIDVELELGASQLRLSVRDNGRGIDSTGAEAAGHWGLRVMQERAKRIGGRLDVCPAAGGGTVVLARVPADAAYLA